jgi:hypothetical protein
VTEINGVNRDSPVLKAFFECENSSPQSDIRNCWVEPVGKPVTYLGTHLPLSAGFGTYVLVHFVAHFRIYRPVFFSKVASERCSERCS